MDCARELEQKNAVIERLKRAENDQWQRANQMSKAWRDRGAEIERLKAENERIRELVRQVLITEGWCPRTKPVPPPSRILKEHKYE